MKERKHFLTLVLYGVIAGAFIFSVVSYCMHRHGSRRVYYFNSYDSQNLCTEVRYIVNARKEGAVEAFVADLLLGPLTNRYRNIFSPETSIKFCVSNGRNLYLGLSEEALREVNGMKSIRDSVGLLKMNIVRNFTKYKNVYIFIDGEIVFAEG
ncbi:MAG: GerMN domain-containing protein [Treponema sp.]|nr:GerMN domain-containing protein [Treponema sp.]